MFLLIVLSSNWLQDYFHSNFVFIHYCAQNYQKIPVTCCVGSLPEKTTTMQ